MGKLRKWHKRTVLEYDIKAYNEYKIHFNLTQYLKVLDYKYQGIKI